MLKVPNHNTIYLVVDALDECDSGISELSKLITNNVQSQVKWLITGRNHEEIERQLRPKNLCLRVSLELNSSDVSRAVDSFINIKVQKLAQEEEYNTELEQKISGHLKDNAKGTFLWVALVCKMLKGVLACNIESTLEEFPPGLDSIYERMMEQVEFLEAKAVRDCKCIIISAILAQRPLHLKEIGAIADLRMGLREDPLSLKKQVQLCGSFLTIREDIVHQSAKDFLITGKGASSISSSHQEEHGKIAYRSIDLLSNTLRKDMCDLRKPGTFVTEAYKRFSQSRFTHVRYACCYWVDHLAASYNKLNQPSLFDSGGKVKVFLQEHLLDWLEVLSILGMVSDGVLMLKHLKSLIDVRFSD